MEIEIVLGKCSYWIDFTRELRMGIYFYTDYWTIPGKHPTRLSIPIVPENAVNKYPYDSKYGILDIDTGWHQYMGTIYMEGETYDLGNKDLATKERECHRFEERIQELFLKYGEANKDGIEVLDID